MSEEKAWITNRFGEELEALVRTPDGNGPFPSVLLVGGFGADLHETNNSFDEIAHMLVKQGFITVQFSFAGKGKSQGEYREMTVVRQGQQIEDILAWVQKNKLVDQSRIGIFALSFGVASALAANLICVRSAVLLGGAYYPLESLKALFVSSQGYNPADISFRKHTNGTVSRVGPAFWSTLQEFDTQKICRTLQIPVYIMHGDNDNKIPVADAKKVFEFFPSPLKRIKIYPGGDHGMVDVIHSLRKEFLQDTIAWYKETL